MSILDLVLGEPGGRRAQGLPSRMSVPELVWHTNFRNLATFHEVYQRWPHSASVDPHEKQLGQWLGNQRRNSNKAGRRLGAWTPDRERLMLSLSRDWESVHRNLWNERYAEITAFFKAEGRWPSYLRPEEASLANWLQNQRRACRGIGHVRWNAQREEQMRALDINWLTPPRGRPRGTSGRPLDS